MEKIKYFNWDDPNSKEYKEFWEEKEKWLNKGFKEACKKLKISEDDDNFFKGFYVDSYE